jgi:PAS domain S-box-containing protein
MLILLPMIRRRDHIRTVKTSALSALGTVMWFLLLSAWPAFVPSIVAAQERPKRVLILSSEGSSSIPGQIIEQSLCTALKSGSPAGVDTYTEYLDATRTRVDGYEKELIAALRGKYVGQKFDLIFAIDASALRVLLQNRSEIFQDSPIVFVTLDERNMTGLTLGSNITGIWGQVNLRPNLELALALQPETRNVVVLAGVSEFDQYWTTKAREDFAALQGRLEITYLIGLNISELKAALAKLPQNTIVFLLTVTRDNGGNNYFNLDVLRQISPTSSVPIYGTTDAQLGVGIVGGRLVSFEAIGTQMAQIGLRVLSGERPEAIAPYGIPSVAMFDSRELKRWGISEQQLPPGSVVRFKELSLWGQYKWRFIGIISLCILEALLIAYLLFTRARRRNAERETERYAKLAQAEHKHLGEVVSNTPGVVWESRLEPGTATRRIKFVNDYVEQMLGYTAEECLATPNFWQSIIHEDDRQKIATITDVDAKDGHESVRQFRCTTKDGRMLWVEAHIVAIASEDDRVTGVRGVAMDITDRKRAEEALRESEHRFQLVSQATKDILYDWNLQTDFVWWNDSAMRTVFGYPLEEMRHDVSWWEERLHPEDKNRIGVSVSETLRGVEQKWENEYRFRKMDNSYAYVYHRAFIVRGEGGEALRAIGSLMDITERRQSEEKLRSALEEVSHLKNQLEEENVYLQEEIKLQYNFEEIVGQSDALKYVLFKIEQVAPTDSTVLITGETGTGKELVARAIHSASRRKDRPLVKVNCAALSASLIESELFGHEKGSFTGASARTIGRFELANGATIFLDEIGELPLELQVKLLRVIQEGEFERLGSSKTIKADVRIIAATNRNLQTEVQRGLFREDLWYRLNVFPITVPPLNQRFEDVPILVEHFVKRFSKRLGKEINSVSPATLKAFRDYSWPGNIRELANVIERAVINTQGSVLRMTDHFGTTPAEEISTAKTLEEIEREHIIRILGDTGWRIEGPNGGAKILGLNPSTLRTRMSKLGIQKPRQSVVSSSQP